ncbi:MAG: STAS domain-containing protein [Chitinispirillia bacterium]|nr:STAS domain-containing protein [Chitinispirillia bacterium]MCL2268484.1 STAS domain-containing protein [Chitinispirillia bacterium]
METQIQLTCDEVPGKTDARIVRFVGDLDATNVDLITEQIFNYFSDGLVKLVADFKQLRYVNSTGLGVLLHFNKTAREKGGCFKIVNLNEDVYEIIEIIGAASLLDIYDEMDEAIAALA